MKTHPVVLVVDGQEVFDLMQPVLKDMLNKPKIIHCKTHQDAMNYIASDQQADFIFADWDLTGYQFMDHVRSDLENHNTPVIIMSEDTKNKKIGLNKVEREATFFLAKPFLGKGLIKKFNKALKVVERRRKNRIHPDRSYLLPVIFNDKHYSLALVDISIDGYLLRVPLETSQQISIYQAVEVTLKIDEFNVRATGEVYRIGHDRPIPESKDTVLVMIKFAGSAQQENEIQDLIDELSRRW